MKETKVIDRLGFQISILFFFFSVILFYIYSSDFFYSFAAALIASGLFWATYVMLRIVYLSFKT